MGVKTFQELFAWQLSARLRAEIVALCEMPALQKDLKLRDQLQDAASSAPGLIAEGFGRYTKREFARYLSMARAELLEVQDRLLDLKDRKYVDRGLVDSLLAKAEHAARVTARLRSSLGGD